MKGIRGFALICLAVFDLACGGSGAAPCSPAPVPLFGYNGTFIGTLGQSPTPLTLTFTQTNNNLSATGTYGEIAVTSSGVITSGWNAQITLLGANNSLFETVSLTSVIVQIVTYQLCPSGSGSTQQVESFTIAPTGDPNPLDASAMRRQQ